MPFQAKDLKSPVPPTPEQSFEDLANKVSNQSVSALCDRLKDETKRLGASFAHSPATTDLRTKVEQAADALIANNAPSIAHTVGLIMQEFDKSPLAAKGPDYRNQAEGLVRTALTTDLKTALTNMINKSHSFEAKEREVSLQIRQKEIREHKEDIERRVEKWRGYTKVGTIVGGLVALSAMTAASGGILAAAAWFVFPVAPATAIAWFILPRLVGATVRFLSPKLPPEKAAPPQPERDPQKRGKDPIEPVELRGRPSSAPEPIELSTGRARRDDLELSTLPPVPSAGGTGTPTS